MKRRDYNKHFSALLTALRNALAQHEAAHSFSLNSRYYITVKNTLDSLQREEEQLALFVNQKQRQINLMPPSFVKDKMQEQLDRIAIYTHKHLRDLVDKYLWLLRNIGQNGSEGFNFSLN